MRLPHCFIRVFHNWRAIIWNQKFEKSFQHAARFVVRHEPYAKSHAICVFNNKTIPRHFFRNLRK